MVGEVGSIVEEKVMQFSQRAFSGTSRLNVGTFPIILDILGASLVFNTFDIVRKSSSVKTDPYGLHYLLFIKIGEEMCSITCRELNKFSVFNAIN